MQTTNGQTGPTTSEGKAISSSNATTHGGTSEKLIVAGEKMEDFASLLEGLKAQYNPETPSARGTVEDFAHAQWFLWRRTRSHNAVEQSLYASEADPALWSDASLRRLTLMDRYRTTAERAFHRALRNLERLESARNSKLLAAQRQQNFEARLAFDRERLALQKERHAMAKARVEEKAKEKQQEAYSEACGEFPVPTLVQEIHVRVDGHRVHSFFEPPNRVVRADLEKTNYEFPYKAVVRKFTFHNGVPPQYHWNDDLKNSRFHYLETTFSRDSWLEVAAQEKKLGTGHAVSGFEFATCDFD
jgi:hypothetical protein